MLYSKNWRQNQTIFNKPDRDIPDQWNIRKVKYLQNSLRLTESIAKVVNPFAVDNVAGNKSESMFTVKGKRQLENGDIPPYLILFDEYGKNKLLTTFNDLIEKYELRSTVDGKNTVSILSVGALEEKERLQMESCV